MFGFKKKIKVEFDNVSGNGKETKPLTNGDAKKYDQLMLDAARTLIREGSYTAVKEMVEKKQVPQSIFKDECLQLILSKGQEPLADGLRKSGYLSEQEIIDTAKIAFDTCIVTFEIKSFQDKDYKSAKEQAQLAMDISEKFNLDFGLHIQAQEMFFRADSHIPKSE